MTKTLIKKQMMEMFSFFWQDKKKNRNRTGGKLVLSVLMYLMLFALIAVIFWFVADMLCAPLVAADMGWLYFALMGLIGIALGAFGSVFNTYASLYQPKDNSMLLAMPVKPESLLMVRLTGVYAMGLMYELLVMIPVLIVYYMVAKPGILGVVFSILITLVLSVFVLTLSAVLGWVVALISSKTRHKSMITVVLSLAFIAAYYYVYGKAYQMLQNILIAPQAAGDFMQSSMYPLYQMGLAAEGNGAAFLIFTGMVLALFLVVYLVLAKSYMKISTSNKGEVKKVYREQNTKAVSQGGALLRKEAGRFLNSPNYMLNCGLGIVLMVIAAVVLVIKGEAVSEVLQSMTGIEDGMVSLAACAAICLSACMNDMSAPSVSLEGKNIWLVQVFPISGWQALQAKLKLHLIATWIPVLLLTAAVEWVLKPELAYAVLIPVVAVVFVLFMGALGLCINLKAPNLAWTSEITPIKQSFSVTVTLFGGWALVVALCGLYFAVNRFLTPAGYLVCVGGLLLAASVALLVWLKKRGGRIFETL